MTALRSLSWTYRVLPLALLCGFLPEGHAAEARVLPKGRSRLSLIGARTLPISEIFSDTGDATSIMSPYQLELSGQNFRRADPRLSQLVGWLNNQTNYRYDDSDTTNHGVVLSSSSALPLLGDALSRGSLGLDAAATRTQTAILYQRGITDRLSLALAIQPLSQSVRFSHAINGRNTARDIYDGFAAALTGGSGAVADLADGLRILAAIDTDTFQQILASKGYDAFADYEDSGLGDTILGGRYLYQDDEIGWGRILQSLQLQIGIPTGKLAPARNLTALDFGLGAWTASLTHITMLTPSEAFTLSNQIGYTKKFPFHRVRRVRQTAGDLLPDAASEEELSVQLGSTWFFSFGGLYRLNPTLSFETQLFVEWKNEDTYSGTRLPAEAYRYFSDGTSSQSRYLQVAWTASSLNAFLKDRFPLPGDLTVTWNQPVSGKNQLVTPYGMAELALYF